MIVRVLAAFALVYLLGFIWFAVALPQPLGEVETNAVIVPTGGAGRIERGIEVLDEGYASEMFVSGVDREVKPEEFRQQFDISRRQMDCCVTLGQAAVDTRSNAKEAAQWVRENDHNSVRLVTTDWHMRRAASEFRSELPADVLLVEDGVRSSPEFGILFLEYNKHLANGLWRFIAKLR